MQTMHPQHLCYLVFWCECLKNKFAAKVAGPAFQLFLMFSTNYMFHWLTPFIPCYYFKSFHRFCDTNLLRFVHFVWQGMQMSWRKRDAVKQHFIWASCIRRDCCPKYQTANWVSGNCCYIRYMYKNPNVLIATDNVYIHNIVISRNSKIIFRFLTDVFFAVVLQSWAQSLNDTKV